MNISANLLGMGGVATPMGISAAAELDKTNVGLGRKIAAGDKAFKGLDVTAVKSQESTVYKYITAKSENADEAKKSLAAVRKKFPEAFVVKVVGNEVSRVR